VVRFGAIIGAGVVAASLASIPAALRVAPAVPSEGLVDVWLALVACALLPAIAGVAVLRAAREGLRAFGGPGASARALGFVVWATATFGAMAVLGALLRATTHHHGLAGVTFAIFALAAAIALALVVRRFVTMADGAGPGVRSLLAGIAVGVIGVTLALTGVGLARAAPSKSPLPPSTGALFVDLLALAIATGFLSRATFARGHVLALLGLPFAAGMFTLGLSFLHRSAILATAIAESAPAFAPAARFLAELLR
jgi:hypothetical protein